MGKVLGDHNRKGKVFQPPLLGIGTFVQTSWLDYAVPEFIWIMLFIQKFGVSEGSRLALQFAWVADDYLIKKVECGSAATMMSFCTLLTNDDKVLFCRKLKQIKILEQCRRALQGFNTYYPESPLSFITQSISPLDNSSVDNFLQSYKQSLANFSNRMSFEASIVIANAVGFLAQKGRLFITNESSIPDLNEIFNYPKTEESKKLAWFLRNTVRIFFSTEWYDSENVWVKYYWNRSIEIEPCLL